MNSNTVNNTDITANNADNSVNNAGNSAKKFATVYKVASAILLAAILAVGSIAFAISFQTEGRYFVQSPIVFALYALLAVAVVLAISAPFIFKRETISENGGTFDKVFSLTTAVASALPFIYYIYSDLTARAAAAAAPSGSIESFYSGLDTPTLLLTVTSLFAVIFSISRALNFNRILTIISGYGTVLFCAVVITKFYLDFSVELNSPIKLLLQFSAAAMMIGTVSDLRPFLDLPSTPLLISSKLFAATVGLLNFAGFAFEVAPNIEKYGRDYVVFAILFLIYGIAGAFRLFTVSVKSSTTEKASEDTVAQEIANGSATPQTSEGEEATSQTSEDEEPTPEADQ